MISFLAPKGEGLHSLTSSMTSSRVSPAGGSTPTPPPTHTFKCHDDLMLELHMACMSHAGNQHSSKWLLALLRWLWSTPAPCST